MARGKHLSLEEARKAGKLDRFAKEHPSTGDAGAFGELLDGMAKGKKPTRRIDPEPPEETPEGEDQT